MNIAVYTERLYDRGQENRMIFFSEILWHLARQNTEHNFFVFATQNANNFFHLSSNLQIVDPGFQNRSSLLKKSWRRFKLPGQLRKIKADVLISFDGQFSEFLPLPQITVLPEGEKIHPGSLKKAKVIIAFSQEHRNALVKKYKIGSERINVVPIAVNEIYKPAGDEEKEKTKANYCDGKEYFFYPEKQFNAVKLMNLLKSFSHFKKRQQSNMKLAMLANPDKKFLKALATYKYRDDVRIIDKISDVEVATLTASSYAVIIYSDDHQEGFQVLKALQSGVPVIASKNTRINEIADEAVLYVGKETETGIGEKMIQIYTDEKLRGQLIGKGETIAGQYTFHKTSEHIWNCIMKAVR